MTMTRLNKTHENIAVHEGVSARRAHASIDTSEPSWSLTRIVAGDEGGNNLSVAVVGLAAKWKWHDKGLETQLIIARMPVRYGKDGKANRYSVTAYLNGPDVDETNLEVPRVLEFRSKFEIRSGELQATANPFDLLQCKGFTLQLSEKEAETLRGGGTLRIKSVLFETEIRQSQSR